MKKLLILILLFAPLAKAQTHTFCAQDQNCTFTGNNTFVSINKILYADQFAGATADVKINACLSALTGTEGTCDARGFGDSVQTIASSVTVGTYQTLLCDPATFFTPSSANLNMFFGAVNSHIKGCSVYLGSLTANSWSGSVFTYNSVNSGSNPNSTSLEDIFIYANNQQTSGTGISLNASSGFAIDFVSLRHIIIYGTNAAISLIASGTGFVNGNHLTDVIVVGSPNGYFYKATGTTSEVNGNICSPCSFEQNGVTSTGIVLTGTTSVSNNIFSPMNIWDTVGGSNPITISNTVANNNLFIGRFDGTISDSTASNTYLDVLHNTFTMPTMATSVASLKVNGTIVATPTTVSKKGSGGGDYTAANTSYAAVDTTNLCTTLTVPTGWKLIVTASGSLGTATSAVAAQVALSDVGATCGTGGTTPLIEKRYIPSAVGAGFDGGWALQVVITGDGNAHSVALLAETTNGSDSWNIQNSTSTLTPAMTFMLMPSN